jgi:hypothetical protein
MMRQTKESMLACYSMRLDEDIEAKKAAYLRRKTANGQASKPKPKKPGQPPQA